MTACNNRGSWKEWNTLVVWSMCDARFALPVIFSAYGSEHYAHSCFVFSLFHTFIIVIFLNIRNGLLILVIPLYQMWEENGFGKVVRDTRVPTWTPGKSVSLAFLRVTFFTWMRELVSRVSFYLAHFNEFYVVQECSPMSWCTVRREIMCFLLSIKWLLSALEPWSSCVWVLVSC